MMKNQNPDSLTEPFLLGICGVCWGIIKFIK